MGARSAFPAARRAAAPLAALALLALGACAPEDGARDAGSPPADAAEDAAPLAAETRDGPVRARVELAPPQPRLGDALTLVLTVRADAGVAVDMPAFGDALGRFSILDFAPREALLEDGGTRLSQRYTLQALASGSQRIPRLRIEYVDGRGGAQSESRELLTDELAFDIASVLPDGAADADLRPPRAELPLRGAGGPLRHWPWLLATALALAAAVAAGILWRRAAARRVRTTAYQRAWERLERLRRAGPPDAARLDGWYVELSDSVRRYIEERFALRAPERTTEEFLQEAGRSGELSAQHRELLSAFLERCDRVKFARYSPGDAESREALDLALRFLQDTRLQDARPEAAGADAAVPESAPA